MTPHRIAQRPAPPPAREAAAVAEWYRHRCRWPVEVVADEARLPLGGGVVAFKVPARLVAAVVARLTTQQALGPALRVADDRVVFLCDANDDVFSGMDLPVGVVHLRAPSKLVLPPPRLASCWLALPERDRTWLPSANAVFRAIVDVATTHASPRRLPRFPYT
ncbi:hypothetical protein [Saccharothrix syringae]|uniref:Uncharacterized protein n=1 Tax=Saccharothrix syringae TaxID=103733 RepID=A0A5Q0GWX2_SACSY|nr:hypothetical protein [Saccharothrix syringae]QFZ18606.1 hypothetical protein EKG83_15075 [Saccharothrix syringae]